MQQPQRGTENFLINLPGAASIELVQPPLTGLEPLNGRWKWKK
jgi:hypothetical protein